MDKVLKVIKPFFVMEVGDTFELSESGKEYVSSFNLEHHEDGDSASVVSSYNSSYSISIEYAKALIDEGYLAPDTKTQENKFVNVFDEIGELIKDYTEELNSLEDDMANMPMCMKVEKETVLTNMVKLLEHLNSLKK